MANIGIQPDGGQLNSKTIQHHCPQQSLAVSGQVGQRQSEGNGHAFRLLRLHQLHPRSLQLLQIRLGHQGHHFDARNLG
ncbi:MAG: hypothetical protein VXZ59_07235 [Cyanobacteriota bacterium]|nr:hypothetical protein [Cyanobacteriota bacterium]